MSLRTGIFLMKGIPVFSLLTFNPLTQMLKELRQQTELLSQDCCSLLQLQFWASPGRLSGNGLPQEHTESLTEKEVGASSLGKQYTIATAWKQCSWLLSGHSLSEKKELSQQNTAPASSRNCWTFQCHGLEGVNTFILNLLPLWWKENENHHFTGSGMHCLV